MTRKQMQFAGSALFIGAVTLVAGTSFAQSGGTKASPARFEIGNDASLGEVRTRLGEQGFDVRKVEFDDGKIEVKGTDASGRCMEIYFRPDSGKELRRERDDDCGRRSGSDDDWYDDFGSRDDSWDD